MSIKSMTAFVRQACDDTELALAWEVRSVNHRFLDVHLRLPDAWRDLEPDIRALMNQYVQRGKVDCQLIESSKASQSASALNLEALNRLLKLSKTIQQKVHEHGLGITPLATLDILQWPGVLQATETHNETLRPQILAELETALQQLQTQRQQEGDKIAKFLRQRSDSLRSEIQQIREIYPEILASQQQKFKQHFIDIEQDCSERLEQELLLWVQKLDIAEELSRLEMHLDAIEKALNEEKPVGRRLDFLMQELNREANTLGSKSQHQRTSQAAIDMKVWIEQMREQVQNVL